MAQGNKYWLDKIKEVRSKQETTDLSKMESDTAVAMTISLSIMVVALIANTAYRGKKERK